MARPLVLLLATASCSEVATGSSGAPPPLPPLTGAELGSPDCPCLEDPGIARGGCVQLFGTCLPLSYGRGCGSHEMVHPSCQLSVLLGLQENDAWRNDYCQARFCFVDADKCLPSNFSMQMGPQAPFDLIGYPISYETCGSFNTWIKSFKSFQLGATTAARPLRVAAPIASYPEVYRMAAPNSTERQPDGAYPYDGFGPYRGTHVELLEFIASKYDFSFQWVSLSQGSIADHGTTPSQSMDACVQARAADRDML